MTGFLVATASVSTHPIDPSRSRTRSRPILVVSGNTERGQQPRERDAVLAQLGRRRMARWEVRRPLIFVSPHRQCVISHPPGRNLPASNAPDRHSPMACRCVRQP
jgi:hypothetical protein